MYKKYFKKVKEIWKIVVLVIYTKIKRKPKRKTYPLWLMTYLEPLHVLPCFGGDQRITHKIELSPLSHYIIKTNKNEMIQNLEEENIIMKYQWHSYKHDYIDARGSLGHSSKPKEKK